MIETIYGNSGNLTVSRGKKPRFMVMYKEFLVDGKLSLLMKYYIDESIDSFVEDINTKVSSPSKKVLKNVDESSTRL